LGVEFKLTSLEGVDKKYQLLKHFLSRPQAARNITNASKERYCTKIDKICIKLSKKQKPHLYLHSMSFHIETIGMTWLTLYAL